jgi:hypothetical protein
VLRSERARRVRVRLASSCGQPLDIDRRRRSPGHTLGCCWGGVGVRSRPALRARLSTICSSATTSRCRSSGRCRSASAARCRVIGRGEASVPSTRYATQRSGPTSTRESRPLHLASAAQIATRKQSPARRGVDEKRELDVELPSVGRPACWAIGILREAPTPRPRPGRSREGDPSGRRCAGRNHPRDGVRPRLSRSS